METDKICSKDISKIERMNYRILADSVIEAAQIVEADFIKNPPSGIEIDEWVVRSELISNITSLLTDKYECVKIESKNENT